jgi:glycosyltransferase involved in cell wall biosynthesis
VVIEAMAAGIPVIGSGAGAIPYLIRDGYNGFVVPVGDVSALETRLRRLLSEADLRRTMGERGYALAHSKFSEQAYVEQFTRAVTEVVGERGSR